MLRLGAKILVTIIFLALLSLFSTNKVKQLRGRHLLTENLDKNIKKRGPININGLDIKTSILENQVAELDLIQGNSEDLSYEDLATPTLSNFPEEVGEDIRSSIPFFNYSSKVDDMQSQIVNNASTDEAIMRICKSSMMGANEFLDEDSFLFSSLDNYHKLGRTESTKKRRKDITVGVYYYPWYGSDFHSGRYLREKLIPKQTPLLGEYNDRACEVIAQHLLWSRYAKIDLWVTSWWGPGRRTDKTIRDHILVNPFLGNTKIAIHYETSGRTKQNRTSDAWTSLHNIGPDMSYIAKHYFDHPNYHHIRNRPVIVIYLSRVLAEKNILQNVTDTMRTVAAENGHNLYIIGDYCFSHARNYKISPMKHLDAVTNFDGYGSMRATGYVGWERLQEFFDEQRRWMLAAKSKSTAYIPGVTPGYNDKGVRDRNAPLSRKINPHDEFGTLFQAMISKALETVDRSTGNMFLINSFNEWHEDTQIEPVTVASPTAQNTGLLTALSSTNVSAFVDYTEGLAYEGYGTRYLDILNRMID